MNAPPRTKALVLPLAGAAIGLMVGLAAPSTVFGGLVSGPFIGGIGAALGALCGASRGAAAGVALVGIVVGLIGMLPWGHRAPAGQAVLVFFAPTALGAAGWALGKRAPLDLRRPSIFASVWDRARIGDALLVLFVWAASLALAGGRTVAAPVLGILGVAALALSALDRRAAQQLASWKASARPEEEGARTPGEETDLGIGDGVRVIGATDGAHPYRDAEKRAKQTRLLGDLDAVWARARRRVVPGAALGAVAAVASLAAFVYPSSKTFEQPFGKWFGIPAAPSWIEGRAPITADVDEDGVEDVIGVHRVPGFDLGGERYIVAATSGATFQTLWATRAGRRNPDKIVWSGGRLFELMPENDVVVIEPTTGATYETKTLSGAYALCATNDGVFVHTRDQADEGQLVDFEGRSTSASRPRDCWLPSQQCAGAKPCTPIDAPKGGQFRVHLDDGAGLMDGEPGQPDGEPLWDRHVYGFDAPTREVLWKAIAPYHQTIEVSYGRVHSHVQSGGRDLIETRSARTGDVLWKTTLPLASDDARTRPALFTVSLSRVYVGLGTRVEVLDRDTGKLLGTIR